MYNRPIVIKCTLGNNKRVCYQLTDPKEVGNTPSTPSLALRLYSSQKGGSSDTCAEGAEPLEFAADPEPVELDGLCWLLDPPLVRVRLA